VSINSPTSIGEPINKLTSIGEPIYSPINKPID